MRVLTSVLIWVVVAAAIPAFAQSPLSGVVKDESGAVVSSATVLVISSSGVDLQTLTDPEGRFAFERALPAQGEVVVRAVGFAEFRRPLGGATLDVVLAKAKFSQEVTVTPTRTEQLLGDVPASVNVISRETIRQSPGVVADDVLRLVPTFSLFRRTSSLASHPTTQGVSLRGIGPSGVSRSLVLLDGVPFNDPFGGWVYWTRVPLDSVDRIEVVDGSTSNVYGNYALGGVINVVSGRPKPQTAEARIQYGSNDTRKADFFASDVWGRLGASIDGSFFDTSGYKVVYEPERGDIDTKATAEYQNLNVKLDYTVNERLSLSARAGYFKEDRNNAKFSTFDFAPEDNHTLWRSYNVGARYILPDQSDLQGRIFTDHETFNSSFLAVPDLVSRDIGRTTLRQRVPTDGFGWSAQWTKPFSTRHLFSAGTDGRRVDGASFERGYDAVRGETVNLLRESGGTQKLLGAYVQSQFWPAARLSLTLSGRVDRWRNYDARNLETSAIGVPTANNVAQLPDRDDTVFSPRVAALYHLSDHVTVWGSSGAGFRAPTLNELYRQFRVGAILTLANDQLGPERLFGSEIGVTVVPNTRFSVRGTWFDNRIKDPVSNVTRLDLVNTRQRQNLGRTHVWGVQGDIDYRVTGDVKVTAGYVYNMARVTEFTASPNVVGRYLPQVPKNRGSVGVSYANPKFVTASVTTLVYGRQFEDDLNILARPNVTETGLPKYATVEMMVTRAVGRYGDVFFGVQNLFDQDYFVGLLPTTIGAPRLVSGGFRVRFSGR